MKIFFIARGLHDLGGLERVTLVIANELSKRNYETAIVCLEKGKPFFKTDPKVKLHYLLDEKRNTLIPEKFTRIQRLRNLYKREQPDIVVFVGSHRSFLNLPAAKGIPSVTWEHFNAHINWHPLHKLSRKLAVKHSAKIVTLTQKDADNYQHIFGATNVARIFNPITIENIELSARTEKRVLAVGRLAGQKGFDMLLEAWAKVENRNNGWKLRIVGSGSHLKKLKQQIIRNGIESSVEIIPATNDIISQYKDSSVFVLSSRYEGFGLVLVEAMAAGLPVVSFKCEAGPSEIVEHNKTGILVPPNNIDKLAEEIDRLLENKTLQDYFSENSLIRVKRFEIEKIITQWEQLFNQLIEKRNVGT